jgi:hypothetical protein
MCISERSRRCFCSQAAYLKNTVLAEIRQPRNADTCSSGSLRNSMAPAESCQCITLIVTAIHPWCSRTQGLQTLPVAPAQCCCQHSHTDINLHNTCLYTNVLLAVSGRMTAFCQFSGRPRIVIGDIIRWGRSTENREFCASQGPLSSFMSGYPLQYTGT